MFCQTRAHGIYDSATPSPGETKIVEHVRTGGRRQTCSPRSELGTGKRQFRSRLERIALAQSLNERHAETGRVRRDRRSRPKRMRQFAVRCELPTRIASLLQVRCKRILVRSNNRHPRAILRGGKKQRSIPEAKCVLGRGPIQYRDPALRAAGRNSRASVGAHAPLTPLDQPTVDDLSGRG